MRATLQALIEDPSQIVDEAKIRREIYRLFHGLRAKDPAGMGSEHTAIIGALPPIARYALLLTSIEGFSKEDAGHILSISSDEVAEQIAIARSAVASMLSSKVLIIEDEAVIALHLKQLLTGMGNDVVGAARTASEAVANAAVTHPDLILADVNLADGSSGIDAVDEILTSMTVPVIFITAFPEKLLTGERPEPAYLIAKPFSQDQVAATVMQALMVSRQGDSGAA